MHQRFTLFLLLLISCTLSAQTTAGFENFGLAPGEALNGSDGSGGFASGNIFLPNDYNEDFNAWSGWAISATTDTETPGFTNDLSAITGGGAEGSTTYAVTFAGGDGSVIELQGEAAGGVVEGLFVTNSTYATLSMLNGDSFAKKFGGETGDDPDFFKLTVRAYLDGSLSIDSVEFYLADYRFEDNSQDYIVQEWTYLDLTPLGNADSLFFSLASSDVGDFGINTPGYFCIDNLTTTDMIVNSRQQLPAQRLAVFPNPARSHWQLDWQTEEEADAQLLNMQGQQLRQFRLQPGQTLVDASGLQAGMYLLRIQQNGRYVTKRLIRQ